MSAHSSRLDINDAARFRFDGRGSLACIRDALVKTDDCFDLRLQFGVSINLIPIVVVQLPPAPNSHRNSRT